MTIAELAKYLKFKPRTIYVKVKRGEIPGSKIGKSWRFQKYVIDQWLSEDTMGKIKKEPNEKG